MENKYCIEIGYFGIINNEELKQAAKDLDLELKFPNDDVVEVIGNEEDLLMLPDLFEPFEDIEDYEDQIVEYTNDYVND